LLFATARAFRWNQAVLDAARGTLRASGLYEGRLWLKLVLAVALSCAVAHLWTRARRVALGPRAALCAGALLLQGVLHGVETLSLDEVAPRWLQEQPGRYLLEGSFAALALWALRPAELER
jgi:hypothetical protein